MAIPEYRWTCHRCEWANEPGVPACAHCGFPALATGVDIAKAKAEPNPTVEGYRDLATGAGWFARVIAALWP